MRGERKQHKRLTYEDRKLIETMYNDEGFSAAKIAAGMDIHVATLYRELNRGRNSSGIYEAWVAHQKVGIVLEKY